MSVSSLGRGLATMINQAEARKLALIGLVVLSIALATGQVSAIPTSTVVSATTDYASQGFATLGDLVQYDVDTYDVVYFDSSGGPIDLGDGLTLHTKSVSLESLDPSQPATLTASGGGNIQVAEDSQTSLDASFKNLKIEPEVLINNDDQPACHNVTISGCDLTCPYGAFWCQAVVTGGIVIRDSNVSSSEFMAIGVIGTATPIKSFLVERCTISAGGGFGWAIALGEFNGNLTFRQNRITSCSLGVAVFSYAQGSIECSHNEITVDQLAWWGGGDGVFVYGAAPSTTSVFNQNTVHLKTDRSIGFTLGAWPDGFNRGPTCNVTVKNSVVDGHGINVVEMNYSHGCLAMNIDHSNLTINGSDVEGVPTADYVLRAETTGNTIMDNATPPSTIYVDPPIAALNSLRGNLQLVP
jgi:hypothetical protein